MTPDRSTGLVPFRVLPPDFQLEVHQDVDGFIYTSKMGPNDFPRHIRSGINWLEHLAAELRVLFIKRFALEPVTLSSVEPDGALLIWLRSREPAPRVALDSAKAKGMLKNVPAHGETIDI